MGAGDTWMNAVIGAVVTVLTSFTGISPVIGGAVAGYLNQRDGVKVGALSGAIAAIPLVLLVLLFGSVLAVVPMMGGGPEMGMGAGIGLAFLLVGFGFLLALSAGFGAVGGYLGEYLHREDVL